jgi:hypothetical protein
MLAVRITCPRCGQELTVTENAPPQVSCPRCLAALVNPASPHSGMRPIPVIPLDQQVERDTRWVTYLTYGVLALLVVSVVLTIAGVNLRQGMFVLLLLGGLATFLYFLGAARGEGKPRGVSAPGESDQFEPPAEAGGAVVLPYGGPNRPHRAAVTPGAVAAGLFSALGVCALGFYILAATVDYNPGGYSRGGSAAGTNYHAHILGGVICLIIAYIAVSIRVTFRWRGFAPGAAAGLCLGMLALGPCAACYLLTLG